MAGPRRVRFPGDEHAPERVEDNRHDVPSRLQGKTDPNVPPDQPLPLRGTALDIFPQGDGAFEQLVDRARPAPIEGEMEAVAVLVAGTSAGNPSVGFLVRLPDGRKVLARTTLKLLLAATGAFVAVHGDPRTRT